MQTIGFIVFGAVDLIVFSVVFTALIWAAVKDGDAQRAGQALRQDRSGEADPIVLKQEQPARPYRLAVAHTVGRT